jgi:hypothetical protein
MRDVCINHLPLKRCDLLALVVHQGSRYRKPVFSRLSAVPVAGSLGVAWVRLVARILLLIACFRSLLPRNGIRPKLGLWLAASLGQYCCHSP